MRTIATAIALAAGGVIATAGTAAAGQPADSVTINVAVTGGDDALGTAQSLTIELFEADGTDVTSLCSQGAATAQPDGARVGASCQSLSDGTFTIGGSGLGDYVVVDVQCQTSGLAQDKPFDEFNATFVHEAGETHTCNVTLAPPPPVIIDVGIAGGPAVTADFGIEVYEIDGDGSILATVTDPSDTDCTPTSPSAIDCGSTDLDVGLYQLGSNDVSGYEVSSVTCNRVSPVTDDIVSKPFGGIGQLDHGRFGTSTYCKVIMQFLTQTVSADIDVVNDDAGTASADDFTIEIFDSADALVASGPDPEPGSGNAAFQATLPIGDYTFGVDGPDGYDISIVVTEFDPTPVAVKPIDDAAAQFTLTRNQTVSAVITADDQAVTDTTVPPTTAPPTTQPADTMPPVTTAPPAPPTTIEPTAVLPATGSTSSNLALVALALLLLGSTAVAATRRA